MQRLNVLRSGVKSVRMGGAQALRNLGGRLTFTGVPGRADTLGSATISVMG